MDVFLFDKSEFEVYNNGNTVEQGRLPHNNPSFIRSAYDKDSCLRRRKKHLDRIKEVLRQYAQEKGAAFDIHAYSSSSDLIDRIESGEEYSIYILDIYMPGITGMSVATELRDKDVNAPIIFLTSSPDFALQAFGVNATHYILKPYDKK